MRVVYLSYAHRLGKLFFTVVMVPTLRRDWENGSGLLNRGYVCIDSS